MGRPRIGMNMSLMDMENPLKAKAICHLKYIDAVILGGGLPVILPPYTERSLLDEALNGLDGFCLIGGPDYLPEAYGGHPQPPGDLMDPRRHTFDLWFAEAVLKRTQKPVLGVCGGQQLINIALGGGLVQDLRTEWKPSDRNASTLQHSDDERAGTPQEGNVYRHTVKLGHHSLIAKIAGATELLTNSYHHQAVDPKRMGEGLLAAGWAPDGVIEVIEPKSPGRFLLGVQWHPERMTDEPQQRAIFEALVAAAGTTGSAGTAGIRDS